MKNGQPQTKMPQPDLANLDQSEMVSNQEAKVVPWFCGQQRFAVTWISPIYDVVTKDAPTPDKK